MQSSRLGFPTVNRWAPLGGSRFGEYTETTTTEGTCGGADFRCSARPEDAGVFSCRPCTTAVMNVFKDLQGQLNRLVVSRGLSRSLLLDIDGRIGPKTVTTARTVLNQSRGVTNLPPDTQAAARWLASAADSLVKELKSAADAAGAPTKPPTPPAPPLVVTPAPPGTAPPGVPVITTKRKTGAIVAGLATLTAVGLVGAAVYSKRKR